MSDYLTQELMGNATAGPAEIDPRIAQIVSLVSPGETDSLLREEVQERAVQLHNRRLERQAEYMLSSPDPDPSAFQRMAERYGQNPSAQEVLDAAGEAFAAAEPDDRRRLLFEQLEKIRGERTITREQTKSSIAERIAEIQAERYERSERTAPGAPVVAAVASAFNYTTTTVAEFIDSFMLPGYYVEMINILRDVDPSIGSEVTDYILPEDARAQLPRLINSMSPEKAAEAADRIIKAARSRSGRFLSDNKLAEKTLLEDILMSFEDEEAGATSIIHNFLAPMDLAFGAGQVATTITKGVRGTRAAWEGFRSMWSFGKGTPVEVLSPFTEGARNVAGLALGGRVIDGEFTRVTDPELLLQNMGTTRAQATGTLFLPKPAVPPRAPGATAAANAAPPPYTPPSGTPFFDEFYLSPAERQAKADAVAQGLRSTFTVRLNDLVMAQGDSGAEALVRIGNGQGTGFTSVTDAQAWGDANLNVPFTVVKDQAGTFQVEFKHLFPYQTDDIGEFIDPIKGYGIGKGANFVDWMARSSTQAELNTVKAQALNQQIAEAFTKLRGDSSKRVQELLLKGEAQFKEYTRADLINLGLNADEIAGYESIRRLTAKVWSTKNESVYQSLRQSGFTSEISVDGGTAFVKEINPSELIGADRLLNQSQRTIDLTTGTKVSLANLDLSKYHLYRFFEDTKNGYSYGVMARAKGPATMRELPLDVLKKIDGWMPRYYNAPYFVREVLDDGRTVAMMTARSPNAASEAVTRLQAQNPGRKFETFHASEVSDEAQSLQDIAMLREQGLLVTSHRKPFTLMDVEGGVATINVNDSVQRMISSSALQEGIGRWTTAMKARFDNTYGKRLGFTMDLARAPTRPQGVEAQQMFDEAMAIYNHVRMVNGIHSAGPVGQWARGMRNKVAGFFYNRDKLPGLGLPSRWLGDEISGFNPRAVRAIKSATFAAYIGLNPVVHGVLQYSMVPTYSGVRHALPYMAKGRFFTDSLILQFSKDPLKMKQVADAMGVRSKYVDDLIRDYNNSGLQQMVDNHLSILGTFGDQRVATAGRTRQAMAAVFNASKAVGFDLGVSADKRAAWLVMRNRALKDGKQLSPDVLKEIAQDAEALTGSLNRSDSITSTDGLFSLFLQFQSHGLKMANRIIGGVTGGRVGGEVGLSGREQRNILVASLLSWGVSGYGVTELVEKLNTKYGGNLPEDVKLALNEGFIGLTINSMFQLADEEGDATRLQASSRFSPFTQSGTMLTNAAEIGKLLVTLNWDQLDEFIPAAASLGFTGRMLDAAKFAYNVAGITELPADDKALAVSEEFFRKFPIVSNALQAHMAYNLGYKFDSRGQPVIEASKGAALASLLGLKTYEEVGIARVNNMLYGEYEPLDDEALSKELENAAQKTLEWMIPLLMRMGDGEIPLALSNELVESHNIAMRTGLDESEWAYYRDLLARGLDRSEFMKGDRLLDTLSRAMIEGDVSVQSLKDRLSGLDFPQKESMMRDVEAMFNERNVESE